MKVHDKTGSMF